MSFVGNDRKGRFLPGLFVSDVILSVVLSTYSVQIPPSLNTILL